MIVSDHRTEELHTAFERDTNDPAFRPEPVDAKDITSWADAARRLGSCSEDRADADTIVRLFMLEKAFYEIAYELANRPDWVGIPLRGVLGLLDNETSAPRR